MKIIKQSLVGIVTWTMMTAPITGIAQEANQSTLIRVKPEKSVRLVSAMLSDTQKRYMQMFQGEMPEELSQFDEVRSREMAKEMKKRLSLFTQGKISKNQLKGIIAKANIREMKRMKQSLFKKIHNLPNHRLDEYAELLEVNPSYSEFLMEYMTAFTRTEKANVLVKVMSQDLDQHHSSAMKKLHWMNEKGLVRDLVSTGKSFESNGAEKGRDYNKKKWMRILLIAGAAIAGAGLVSWGIASAKYGGNYKDKVDDLEDEYNARRSEFQRDLDELKDQLAGVRSELDANQTAEFNNLVNNLSQQFNQLNANLTSQEQQYLQDNGFARTLCATYTSPAQTICNAYNYAIFSGDTVCTVMCQKNIATGQETLHEPPQCTSPFIPADCFSQKAYDAEVDQGFNDGYEIGYDDGQLDGDWDGWDDGDNDGANDGYDDGYDDGFDDGYVRGDTDGFDDGYDDGFDDLWFEGYDDGYTDGYNVGLAEWEDYQASQDTSTDDSWDDYTDDGSTDDDFWTAPAFDKSNGIIIPLKAKDTRGKRYKKGFEEGKRDAFLTMSVAN